jgi:hypothetical protein
MKKFQIVSAVVLSASLGVVIPFGVPSHWLKYALGRGLIFALVVLRCVLAGPNTISKAFWVLFPSWL